jgi:hypothetical protein
MADQEYLGRPGQALYVDARRQANVGCRAGAGALVYSSALARSNRGWVFSGGLQGRWPTGQQVSNRCRRPGWFCLPVNPRRGTNSNSDSDSDSISDAKSIAFTTAPTACTGSASSPAASREVILCHTRSLSLQLKRLGRHACRRF